MFSRFLAAAFLILCATCASATDVLWLNDLDSALTEAARSRKPVFLHFYADWCVPCHRLERVVFRDDQWIRYISQSFVPLKINLDSHPELARKYGVTSIPTDVYLTADGEVIANERSPTSVEGYSQAIAQINKREPTTEMPPEVPGSHSQHTDQAAASTDRIVGKNPGGNSGLEASQAPVAQQLSGGSSFFAEALGQSDQATASRDRSPVK